MSELPKDYRDYPRSYVGQPRRHVPDDFSTDHDPANPDMAPGRENAEDALNPEKPSGQGGSGSPTPIGKKRRSIRWKYEPKK